jgi:hypothetical protein
MPEWRFVQLTDSISYWTIIPGNGPEYASSSFVILAGQCGDFNNDHWVNMGDAMLIVSYLYRNFPPPVSPRYADVNSDGMVNILDVIYMIRYLLKGGPAPVCP